MCKWRVYGRRVRRVRLCHIPTACAQGGRLRVRTYTYLSYMFYSHAQVAKRFLDFANWLTAWDRSFVSHPNPSSFSPHPFAIRRRYAMYSFPLVVHSSGMRWLEPCLTSSSTGTPCTTKERLWNLQHGLLELACNQWPRSFMTCV